MVRRFVASPLVNSQLDWTNSLHVDITDFVLTACRGHTVGWAKPWQRRCSLLEMCVSKAGSLPRSGDVASGCRWVLAYRKCFDD